MRFVGLKPNVVAASKPSQSPWKDAFNLGLVPRGSCAAVWADWTGIDLVSPNSVLQQEHPFEGSFGYHIYYLGFLVFLKGVFWKSWYGLSEIWMSGA